MTVTDNFGKPFRHRLGVLFCIGMLLLASAILRLSINVGPAIASNLIAAQETTSAQPISDTAQAPINPEGLGRMLKELQAKEAVLNEREKEIESRLKAIEIADAALERKLAELIEVEKSLSETLALADGAAEADISRLVDVYEKMKPKDAAALFEEMDPAFASGFLARMNANSAAGIMAKLSPQTAYTISALLAGRNAEVPKE